MNAIRRWLEWSPPSISLADANTEPTEATEGASDGSVGLRSGTRPVVDATACAQSITEPQRQAMALLNGIGARAVWVGPAVYIGLWSDLDSPQLRSTIRTLGWDEYSVMYLDSSGVPPRYKVRRVAGDCVPLHVLRAMEADQTTPWVTRDRMLLSGTHRTGGWDEPL
jgi:hypothetical protein